VRQSLTVWISTQGPHGVRSFLGRALGLAEHRIRVIMGDVGGGFGQKMFAFREECAVVLSSKLLGRPVKFVRTYTEELEAGKYLGRAVITDLAN